MKKRRIERGLPSSQKRDRGRASFCIESFSHVEEAQCRCYIDYIATSSRRKHEEERAKRVDRVESGMAGRTCISSAK